MLGSDRIGSAIERRSAVRYQLRAPVLYKLSNDETSTPGTGFVQDLSTEGVFVLSPRALPAGDAIELEILLPPFGTYDTKLFVRYIGVVVRVEDSGFAVAAKVSLQRHIKRKPLLSPGEESQ